MSASGGKTAGVVLCLIFGTVFGAVGAFATYGIVTTLMEGHSAKEWVRVRADVLKYDGDGLSYRYRVAEKDYTGRRLALGFMEPSEIDSELHDRLNKAVAEKKPVTVFVDPNDPSRSVVDPAIPWTIMLALSPFALGFGGVGLGALVVLMRILGDGSSDDDSGRIASDAGSGLIALLVFTFFWNAISIPIALLTVPEGVRSGEWAVLLVLIFPLIGLLLLYATAVSAWGYVVRGGATMHVQHAPPRLGTTLAGHVDFPRGAKAGDTFRTKLACVANTSGNATTMHWSSPEQTLRVTDAGGNRRLAFRFEVPGRIANVDRDEPSNWRLELSRPGATSAEQGFAFEMMPAFGVEHLSDEDEEAEDADRTPTTAPEIPKGMEGLVALMGAHKVPGKNRAEVARALAQMSPDQKEAVEKMVKHGPLIKKLIFWAIGLFVLLQVVAMFSVFLFAS